MSEGARLDVIAELAAHQQNLEPPPAPTGAALLALPLPPVAAVIGGEALQAWRAGEVAAIAEERGGGDGPLPVVDRASGGAPLAALWDAGVRALHVYGAEDQPGLMRAIRYRWPGALHVVDGAGAAPLLFDPREPVRWLGDGLVWVAPGVAPPAGAAHVLAALDEDGDPRTVRAPGVAPYAIDPARRLGVWSGALPPRGRLGTAEGERLRARWQAHWEDVGQPAWVRLAALGLDPDLEAALRAPAAPPRAARRARVFAITGIDGSGKSSHADRLARGLRDRGADVRVLKLYRQGAFLELANELGARTRRGAPVAAFRTSRVVKLVDSLRVYRDHVAPGLDACDALVMDRYVETHVAAAASQLGWDLAAHPALAPFPPADLRVWLEVDPDVALARRDARAERPSADEHAVGLRGYAREFARLAAGELRLDAAAPADDNARIIAERAAALLPALRGGGEIGRAHV